ncbi:MAG TPA: N-acetylmuramoyl-L-alanine amidase [Methylophilaceae bacterium]|jgi:N-acetylmuramoyl-L-alanine amidase
MTGTTRPDRSIIRHIRLWLSVTFLLLAGTAQAALNITATRVWPAPDYTRITFEAKQPIQHSMIMLKDPERLVIDLQEAEISPALRSLGDKVLASDPYIKAVRVGNFKPGVVRVVVDLKSEIRPEIFALPPAGEYDHRLVLDIYPLVDPLLALLQQLNPEQATEPSSVKAPDGSSGEAVTVDNAPETGAVASGEETAPDSRQQAAPPAEKPLTTRMLTIVVDAGHGGEDPGAIGFRGSKEKDVTLSIAKKLKAQIDREPNMRAILTRDGDFFLPLNTRVQKARKAQADLFVSIHADAFARKEANGSSVFALSERGATSAFARYLAQKENESDLIGGVSLDVKDPHLARTLLDLSQTATINDSLKLGQAVLNHLGKINRLHKPRVEQAGFAVLKAPDIPSILVETAFISNPDEEKRLNDPGYQDKMAASILAGIKQYFSTNPPLSKARMAESRFAN